MQQDQGTAAVAAFVRDGDGGAVFKLGQVFDFLRVTAKRLNVNAGHGHQVGAFAFVEAFQVRQGLEVVGVQVFFGHLHVGLHIIGEDLDFQIHAFFGEGWFDQLKDFGVRHRRSGNHQFFASLCQACSQSSRQCGKQQNLFHAIPLCV